MVLTEKLEKLDALRRQGEILSDRERSTTPDDLEAFKTDVIHVLIVLGQEFVAVVEEVRAVEFRRRVSWGGEVRYHRDQDHAYNALGILLKLLNTVRDAVTETSTAQDARPPIVENVTETARMPSADGAQKLPSKKQDISRFLDSARLTGLQRETASLRWEFGLSIAKIAKRRGVHHSVVQESLNAAKKKMDLNRPK